MVLITNLIVTLFLAGAFAPAAFRYAAIFRAGGLTAIAPFVILPLYVGPALLWIRPPVRWYVPGFVIGVLLAIPLALWTLLQNYPVSKAPIILATGALQGLVLSWIAYGRKWQKD
jgi:hypothetical protein